jgi:5-methylcytosine-specific restriction endonuclease McrA
VMDISRRKRAQRKNAIIEKFSAAEIYERDHWTCQLCHKPVNKKLHWPNPMSPTLDHIIPISKGGAHERRNTQLAHARCNMKASNRGIKQIRLFG